MRKWLILLIFIIITLFLSPALVAAQTNTESGDHTAREEQEGKEIWGKLQAKQLECNNLTDENYAVLGEYFMGQSIGNTERHAAMNQMMISMVGEQGEEQMHVVMGKRNSGCDTGTKGGGNPMMGYGGWGNMMGWGFGILGWLFMLLFWLLIILGVVALVRYLGGSGKTAKDDKTPVEILKERYARGEIDKKEFEEKKKDLD
ncbi:MAG: SHOCT domain-containing protein [Candidatus Blackburnbacteria bacterium]|nr:SHOCT domain-containing protein [Candidatus Blackburnbacteria bacterium]